MRKPVGGLAHFDAMMDNWERLINEGKYAEGLTELENTLSGVPGLPPLEELQTMARRSLRPAAASHKPYPYPECRVAGRCRLSLVDMSPDGVHVVRHKVCCLALLAVSSALQRVRRCCRHGYELGAPRPGRRAEDREGAAEGAQPRAAGGDPGRACRAARAPR